jgi:hypothetical protein
VYQKNLISAVSLTAAIPVLAWSNPALGHHPRLHQGYKNHDHLAKRDE